MGSTKRENCLGLETHSFMVHGNKFEVSKKYTILEPVGQGAYGIVCAAKDENDERLAIKKIENAFEHFTFTKRTLRELRILRSLYHENLLDIKSVFLPGAKEGFEDIYVVSELMETDLASILKSTQPITNDHVQFFLYQILRGMKYVHSAGIIHRDLKPRNLLVNSNCDLKICDFGLARASFESKKEFRLSPMTEYVCTRWYRAPEVLCSWEDYGYSIDVWSIGCILGEMLGRKAMFPGKDTQNQLQLVVAHTGTPKPEELKRIPNEKCRKFIQSLPPSDGKDLAKVFKSVSDEQGLDLLRKMLKFDPDRRITVEGSLKHAYLASLHCPEDEPTRDALDTAEFEFERRKITVESLREELFLEALSYYPEKKKEYMEKQRRSNSRYNVLDFRLLEKGESQYTSDEDEDD